MKIKVFYDKKHKTIRLPGIIVRVVALLALLTLIYISLYGFRLIGEDAAAVLISLSWIILGPVLFVLLLHYPDYSKYGGGVFVLLGGRLYCQKGIIADSERDFKRMTSAGFDGFNCGGFRADSYAPSRRRYPFSYVPVESAGHMDDADLLCISKAGEDCDPYEGAGATAWAWALGKAALAPIPKGYEIRYTLRHEERFGCEARYSVAITTDYTDYDELVALLKRLPELHAD